MPLNTGFRPAAAVAVIGYCGLALAHSGATGIVKERMDAMKDIAAQMKQIGAMIKRERDFDAGLAASSAIAIARHAETIPSLFPQGSGQHPSEALPAIWSDWDRFFSSAEDLRKAALALSEAAKGAAGTDQIQTHFTAVGKVCSACHEDFRQAQ